MPQQTDPKPPGAPEKTGRKSPGTAQRIPSEVLQELTPEILEKLPEQTKIAVIEARSFKGPLPPPSLFRQYDETLPGSAERIMQLSEKEQSHRHQWDNKALEYEGKEVIYGQWFGFILGILGISGGIFCAYIDQPWVAAVLVGTSLAGIVTAFIKGRSG